MMRNIILQSLFAASALGATIPPKQRSWGVGSQAQWQIILSGTPTDVNTPASADVWDIDLFNTPVETISNLKSMGKTVVCYFSAGTSEPSRPDLGGLGAGDVGNELKDWPGEYWLNLKSDNVFNIMKNRIAMAAQNGCDAVDPDNVDGYQEGAGGLGLTTEDSIAFVEKMAQAASQYGLAIGLKNAIDILPSVSNYVQFAVNEECAAMQECSGYDSFLATGKPVFHIEYSAGASAACQDSRFNTVVKDLSLNGWVQYCDGTSYTTPTSGDSRKKSGEH